MTASPRPASLWRWAGLVALVASLERLALWRLYRPVVYGDTGSYRRLAESVLNGWQRYDGTRTPGYPMFLAAVGDDERVFLAQMGLGLGITLLLFAIGWWASGRAWFGALAGLAHSANLGQLFFEANLLTETLATFWVVVCVAGVFSWWRNPRWRHPMLALFLGISASLAWLTRPQFLYLPFWTALFLALPTGDSRPRPRLWAALAAFLPAALILAGWTTFIQSRFHTWSVSAMSGYNLIQHTGNYFEYVPDEYAAIRDTYLRYRDEHIARYGTQTNTIWEAIPEMQKASGQSFYQLSRTLTSISLQLIWEHPSLYLRNVIRGWWFFWRAPVYWTPDALRSPALEGPLAGLVLAERLALVAANLAFVTTSLAAMVSTRLRRIWRLAPGWWYLAGSIWLASILQTLVDHGDNPRFLVPMQSLVVLWGLWALVQTRRWAQFRRAGGAGR